MQKFYATFKEINGKEIAEFPTERQRDDWVTFKDIFSKEFDVTPENATFSRIALTTEEAHRRIAKCPYTYPDCCNDNQIWYSKQPTYTA